MKQVEIFGRVCEKFAIPVPEDIKLTELNTIAKLSGFIAAAKGASAGSATAAAPATSAPAPSGGALLADVKSIIAEMTGYGAEMLDENLDLEGDLGIDTVKQVEIFGRVCEKFAIPVPEDIKLTELNTIAKLSGFISAAKGASAGPVTATAAAPLSAATPATSAPAPSGGTVMGDVKNIIAEMTGYGAEMLEENLDLEGDLGIDTVKQVEIFGRVCEKFAIPVPEDIKLTELNTIAKLSGFIAAAKGAGVADASTETAGAAPQVAAASHQTSISRFVVRTKKLQVPAAQANFFEGKKIAITMDDRGLAKKIGDKIAALKGQVVSIGAGGDVKVDITDPAAVETSMKELAAKGAVDGFIHVAPVSSYLGGRGLDRKALDAGIKSLFTAVKGLYGTLNRKGAFVASLAFDSVVFPYEKEKADIYPLFGAVDGFLKSLNKEMDATQVKMVDFDSSESKNLDSVAQRFLEEISSGDTRVEVGYRGSERFGISLIEKSPEQGGSFVKEGDTVLVTGGARGITFEILKEV